MYRKQVHAKCRLVDQMQNAENVTELVHVIVILDSREIRTMYSEDAVVNAKLMKIVAIDWLV